MKIVNNLSTIVNLLIIIVGAAHPTTRTSGSGNVEDDSGSKGKVRVYVYR
jgi:hypothetical protein